MKTNTIRNLTAVLLVSLTSSSAFSFPMERIQSLVQQAANQGRRPIAVMDLDETLIHSAKRMIQSYVKVIERNNAGLSAEFPVQTQMAYQKLLYSGEGLIRSLPNQYDAVALFHRMGINNEAFAKKMKSLVLPIYLSNEFINLDSPIRGAVGLMNLFYQAGGRVYFVTSRFQDTQATATSENLRARHLYYDDTKSILIMRKAGENSLGFKSRSYQQIKMNLAASDQVILVGENEPENMNALEATFPEAQGVFVTGAVLNTKIELEHPERLIFTKDFSILDSGSGDL